MQAARNTLSADEEFLCTVKQKCSVTDEEQGAHKTRQIEMQAAQRLHVAHSASSWPGFDAPKIQSSRLFFFV